MSARTSAECVVIGGGLAGLACGHDLARDGVGVTVLEASPELGGRARSHMLVGRPVDVGFQSLFRGYPATRALCAEVGLENRDFMPFTRGLAVFDGATTRYVTPTPGGLARIPGVGRNDAARLGWRLRDVAAPGERLLRRWFPEATTAEYLEARGVPPALREGLVRPFFGSVFLDRSLSADPGYFLFLASMMMRGPVVIPREGLGVIAARVAARARATGAVLETGARVTGLAAGAGDGMSVTLADGREIAARRAVLAADAPSARALLEPVDPASAARLPTEAASVTTAAFVLDRPLYRGRTPILNSSADAAPRIDLLCQTTNVTNPGEGAPHILLASSITTGVDPRPAPEDVAAATGRLVARMSPGFPWEEAAELLDTTEHPFAQFIPRGGVRARLPGPQTALPGLVLAGDMTTHPSIEGAVSSGRRAARVVAAALSA